MNKFKQYLSILLYFLSILIIIGVGTDTILISGKLISTGKEVNIYGLIYYYQYLFLSIILWGISYYLYSRTKLNIAYWVTFIVITILVML